jgi:hypothetical protein
VTEIEIEVEIGKEIESRITGRKDGAIEDVVDGPVGYANKLADI